VPLFPLTLLQSSLHKAAHMIMFKMPQAPMVKAALFTVVKKWKQPKCPSTDGWLTRYGISIKWNIIQPWKGRAF
jgi:hypothetical protein